MSRKTSWGHFVVFCINRNRIRAMILPIIPLPTLEPPLPTSSKDKCNSLKSRSHECKKTSLIDQLVLNQNSGYQFQPQMFLFFFGLSINQLEHCALFQKKTSHHTMLGMLGMQHVINHPIDENFQVLIPRIRSCPFSDEIFFPDISIVSKIWGV